MTTDRRIRLVDGTVPNEGRVEVRAGCNTEWGTVCDDLWDTNDAQVACCQLGYGTDGAIAYSHARFGQDTGDIYLDNLGCTGSETSIFDCQNNGFGNHNCNHFEDAGVFCPTSKLIIVSNPNRHIHINLRTCIQICIPMYIRNYKHAYIPIYIYTYVCMYVCM